VTRYWRCCHENTQASTLAILYLVVGIIGFAYHFPELRAGHPDAIWIELTEFLAIVAGVFMLLGRNWARWLALAWIAFHVVRVLDSRAKLTS
jgi:hypothetical protein